jgi:hypothetical protein
MVYECRSVYMTADYRVLRCDTDRETHESSSRCYDCCAGCGPVYHGNIDEFELWQDDSVCSWDGTCAPCEGYGIVPRASMAVMGDGSPVPKGNTCAACEGTGVDVNTIPLHLIGKGSTVRARAKTSCREVFLINVDTTPQVLGYCTSCEDEHTMDLMWDGWKVVRAVPPSNLEEMML